MWRIRHVTVAAELALAIALSVGGALLALSLFRLTSQDPGFSATGVAAVRVSAYPARYPTMEDVHTFFSTVVGRVETLHGVAQAAAASSLPLSGTNGTSVQAEGQPVLPGSRQSAGWQFVSPGYLGTLGMPIRRGRDFTADDLQHGGHVSIINEQLARALFGDTNPIGHRIAVGGGDATGDWHEVIGVVADVRHHSLDVPPMARVYDLFGEHWGRTLFVVARARTSDAGPLIGAIRKTVAGLDPEAPAFESATMEALVARSAGPRRLAAGLAVALGSVAVLLALVGVAAAAGAAVTERTREIGIRAALGAAPRELLRLVLRDSTRTAAAGAVAGVLGSAACAKLLSAQLYDVRAADVTLIIPIVAIVLLCVAVLSTLPAARRAASVDPAAVTRE
jgi:putative ABC transport system permease protein